MNLTLLGSLAVLVIALIVAGFVVSTMLERREILRRATEEMGVQQVAALLRPEKAREGRLRTRLQEIAKEQKANAETQTKLVQAGWDSPTHPAVYFLCRLASIVLIPVLALILIPRTVFLLYVTAAVVAAVVGLILPAAALDRAVRVRQERLTKSVPDALDLLVVCVEAGISLDAAILRVAKEIRLAHPDLAHELVVVNRVVNAGLPRETALRGLWQRTGVTDLRSLVSSMIQSEKWGTSIATVLRVYAETLRRRRRQYAEKKAKMAPLKMTFPLLLFILPALFTVIMGPAVVQIIKEFSKI